MPGRGEEVGRENWWLSDLPRLEIDKSTCGSKVYVCVCVCVCVYSYVFLDTECQQ